MAACPGCGTQYAYLRKQGYCCGHCKDNRGHGKNCPVRTSDFSGRHRDRDRSRSRPMRRRPVMCGSTWPTARSSHSATNAASLAAFSSWVVRTGGAQRATATVVEATSVVSSSARPEIAMTVVEDTSAVSSSARPGYDVTPHCVVCMERPCTHACLPCGHRCLCEICAAEDSMHRMNWKCPECRQPVHMATRIYV